MKRKTIAFSLFCFAFCFLSAETQEWKNYRLPKASKAVNQRIEEHRKGDVTLTLFDTEGHILPRGTEVHIELINHDFLFGCNFFNWGGLDYDAAARQSYREQFSALFNFATLPFYWGWYEAERGKPDLYTRSAETARWCRLRDIRVKGHPLVWHEGYPEWAEKFSVNEMHSLLEQRVRTIVSENKGLIDIWDVINESQSSHKFSNPLGQWIKETGADNAVKESFFWAKDSNPDSLLLINDYDVKDTSYKEQINRLIESGTVPDAIGVQSHMHHGVWNNSTINSVYARLESFQIPIHFTELTVLSGATMQGYDYSYSRQNWKTTPWGEKAQAKELVRIYRLLFSLPLIEAVTYWDFSDSEAWLGAPAGLIREDMTPKPAYYALMKLIHNEWKTEKTLIVDQEGRVKIRGFYGDYCVSSGELTGEFSLMTTEPSEISITLRNP